MRPIDIPESQKHSFIEMAGRRLCLKTRDPGHRRKLEAIISDQSPARDWFGMLHTLSHTHAR